MSTETAQKNIETIGIAAKAAADKLAQLDAEKKRQALLAMAVKLAQRTDAILEANAIDVQQAEKNNISRAFLDRLQLDQERLKTTINGLRAIADLPDVVGKTVKAWHVPSGLNISRVTVPLGVVAIIYESRPNVTVDAAALCIKSGNAVILRGGSECARSNKILSEALQAGLNDVGVSKDSVQYLPTQDRAAIDRLLALDDYIDVVIPRGGKSLIQYIREKSRIPIFSHLDGLCHTYVHYAATLSMAKDIVLNAKMRRTGICGATETLLIDAIIAEKFLPQIVFALIESGCEVRGDSAVQRIVTEVKLATEDDWRREYLDAIVSIKVVADIDAAIAHINEYGSHHTDAIITEDQRAARWFQQRVNSAIVMHNASTQFADGGEFGMGAEIGIATGKLHARGPVGVEQLTTIKYIVTGSGQTRAA